MIPGKSTTVADFEDRGPGQGRVAEYNIKYLTFIGSWTFYTYYQLLINVDIKFFQISKD